MAIYRVSIREYDDFPGHTQSWEVFSAVVKTETPSRIEDIVGSLSDDQKLIIKKIKPLSIESFRKFWLNESKTFSDD